MLMAIEKWSARPSAAVGTPPSKLAGPSRPAATDWKTRIGATPALMPQKTQA